MARWIHIGDIPIDSATVMLTDPNYLSIWNNMSKKEEKEYKKKLHKRLEETREHKTPDINAVFDTEDKSYNDLGAANATAPFNHLLEMVNPTKSGILTGDEKINTYNTPNLAAVCSTGGADGIYPVYIKYNEQTHMVTSMKIVFSEDEDELQDEIVAKEDLDNQLINLQDLLRKNLTKEDNN